VSLENVEKLIKDHKVEFVDLRFTDVRGVQHHVTFPKSIVDASLFEDGKMFDGSSISGWKGINESDMVLLPDASTAIIDPFTADPTLILTCDILDPATMQAYARDPRGVAKRAEAYLKSSGIADTAFFGRSRNSSSSTASVSPTRWATPSSTSTRKKRHGTPAANTKAATPATVRA